MSKTIRTIKKYPNRRLYDTNTSCYITLAEVKKLVLEQEEFRVVDTKTNEDLTREILLQIILEEETSAAPIFSNDVLTQMIRCYGSALQGVMGTYLDRSVQSFLQAQHKLQDQFRSLYGDGATVNGDTWAQFLTAQVPAMQKLMGSYLEQSANMFMGLQQQVEQQTRQIFNPFGVAGEQHDSGAASEPGASRQKNKKRAA